MTAWREVSYDLCISEDISDEDFQQFVLVYFTAVSHVDIIPISPLTQYCESIVVEV